MNYLHEKISYVRGLADGLGLNQSSKEGKVLVHIIDVLEELEDMVNDLKADHLDIEEYIEAIDEDLSVVEDKIEDFEDEE